METRLKELADSEHLGAAAAGQALLLAQPAKAMELLEEARGVFWSQALSLRNPLEDIPSDTADELRDLFSVLETRTLAPRIAGTAESARLKSTWGDQAITERRQMSDRAEQLIGKIRSQPGFDRFLLAQPFSRLASASTRGAVVVLIAYNDACHAIIIAHPDAQPQHVKLPGTSVGDLAKLSWYAGDPNMRRVASTPREVAEASRAMKKLKPGQPLPQASWKKVASQTVATKNEQLSSETVLSRLWRDIVKPVIDALGLKASL